MYPPDVIARLFPTDSKEGRERMLALNVGAAIFGLMCQYPQPKNFSLFARVEQQGSPEAKEIVQAVLWYYQISNERYASWKDAYEQLPERERREWETEDSELL